MTAEEKEKAYWLQRFTDQTAAVHDEVDRATEELRQAWAAIIQDVANEINGWYNRFAAEQGLTMAEAKKALTTKELAGLKMSLREFEKLAKANANGKWEKELSAASARVRISRLEAMELGIRNYLWKAYQNTHNTAADTLRNAYTSEYYHNTYEMQRAAGKFTPMQEIPEDIINAALSHPWAADGREWSERIWDNREQVTCEMQGELVRSIIQGKGAYESSLRLAQKMGTGQYQAVRLLQTEATYITTMADVDSFGAMGVEKVQYVATLEAHTCGTCGGLDDKIMNRKDAVPGVTAPPMHPNCRCTLVPYYGDNATRRWMKDPSTFERKTTGDISFKEWQEKYIIKLAAPRISGEQQNRYKPVIEGKESGKSLHYGKIISYHVLENTAPAIYKEYGLSVKPRQLSNIQKRINEAEQALNINNGENFPKIIIVGDNRMRPGAVAAYNPFNNEMLITRDVGAGVSKIKELQKGFACANNEISTFVHELIHWKMAQEFKKRNGEIPPNYLSIIRGDCKKRLARIPEEEYTNVSEYAALSKVSMKYDEVYTEYLVNMILKGKG